MDSSLMASIEITGFKEYFDLLNTTESQVRTMCGRAIHPGAKIVANEAKKQLRNIPVDSTETHKKRQHHISQQQKNGLIESMGIAKMRRTGDGWDVKLGFDGYNDVITSKWPKGQPNAMIARSLNKGTSFIKPYPFMDKAIRISEKQCIEAMEKEFNKQLEKYWGRQ